MIISGKFCGKEVLFVGPEGKNIYPISSASLVTGDPGAGKTTLLLAIAAAVLGKTSTHYTVDLVSSGEDIGTTYGVHYACSGIYTEEAKVLGFVERRRLDRKELLGELAPHVKFLKKLRFDLENVDRPLNSSQIQVLNVFSSIKQSMSYFQDRENFLVILDGVDSGLHPVFQRSFIYVLTEFLVKLRKEFKFKQVQLIVGSDSPFVIGDFTPEYICFLHQDYWNTRNKCELSSKGLAAPINAIYNLSLGCSTISEFATKTINKTIENLKNGACSELDSYVISAVGDQIIQRELAWMKSS